MNWAWWHFGVDNDLPLSIWWVSLTMRCYVLLVNFSAKKNVLNITIQSDLWCFISLVLILVLLSLKLIHLKCTSNPVLYLLLNLMSIIGYLGHNLQECVSHNYSIIYLIGLSYFAGLKKQGNKSSLFCYGLCFCNINQLLASRDVNKMWKSIELYMMFSSTLVFWLPSKSSLTLTPLTQLNAVSCGGKQFYRLCLAQFCHMLSWNAYWTVFLIFVHLSLFS